MKQSSTQATASVRVLVVDVPWYPVKRQRAECAPYGEGVEYANFEHWVSHARGRDTMVVAALRLLHDGKRGPVRPGPVARIRKRISEALKCGVVVEASTGITSAQPSRWAEVVQRTLAFVRSGGHMVGEAAKQRSARGSRKGGRSTQRRSLVWQWEQEPKLLAMCQDVWRSRGLTGDEQRMQAVNAHLIAMGRAGMQFTSPFMARKVLGKIKSK